MSNPNNEYKFPAAEDPFYRVRYYVEEQPVAEYRHASPEAREAFLDMKYGIRIHWGLYSLVYDIDASWPLILTFDNAQRQAYQESYKRKIVPAKTHGFLKSRCRNKTIECSCDSHILSSSCSAGQF